MDGNSSKSAAGGGGGGGGGPAPFLLKTYEMVDDSATDEIVSWSSNRNSFVVWNPPEFARLLLPTYFKHNNFSSFIRQLNTYGFRKIDPERWEFANEDFVKDQKYLLKNIHRRKPIHSHSNPQGSSVDPERASYEEEIDKLSREKSALEKGVLRYRQQQPAAKLQLEELTQRVDSMEQRQDNLLMLLKKSLQDPVFVDHLAQKLESMDFSAYNKKRRLPGDNSQSVPEDSFVDVHSPSRPEFGNVFHDDFANKLRLELTPVVSDINVMSNGTQSSNEDGGSPQIRLSEDCVRNTQISPCGLPLAPESVELLDTGTSFAFNMDPFVRKTGPCESPSLHCMQPSLTANDEPEGHLLNLTLASCVSQVNTNQNADRLPPSIDEIGKPSEWMSNANRSEPEFQGPEKNRNVSGENVTLTNSQDPPANDQAPAAPAAAQARVNDVFWEQFLTERPGSSDVVEASSSYRATTAYEQEDKRSGHVAYGNTRNLQNLTL